MKIAIYGCNEGEAGFGHVFINLINELGKRCENLVVLTHEADIPDYDKINPQVERKVLGSGKGFKRALQVASYLRREQPDLVLCDSNREKNSRILLQAKALSCSHTKIVFRLGTPHSRIAAQRNWLNAFFYRFSVRRTFAQADVVIANSQGVYDDLVALTGLPSDRIRIVNNSTISSALFEMAEVGMSDPWFADSQQPVILGIGRLRKVKDFEVLIKAFTIVRAKLDCRLAILGEGEERAHLEALIRVSGLTGEIKLYGHVHNPFVYFKRAALFVLSSRFEGSPNVLIEALALGVPVVATDCISGPREILAEGLYGPLVPVGDATQMAAAMLAVLAAPLPPQVLQGAVTRFDAGMVAAQYQQIFAAVCAGEPLPGHPPILPKR